MGFRDGAIKEQAQKEPVITVSGLTVERYNELRQKEAELNALIYRIASCAELNAEEIRKKEEKYREARRKKTEKEIETGERATPEEVEEIEKLENEWCDAIEQPKLKISKTKVEKLILDYAVRGMRKEDAEKFRYCDGLPKKTRIEIK